MKTSSRIYDEIQPHIFIGNFVVTNINNKARKMSNRNTILTDPIVDHRRIKENNFVKEPTTTKIYEYNLLHILENRTT